MTHQRGASVGDYQAPLFLAWQLTNRCSCRCLHCCEESGPDQAWGFELSKEEALGLAAQIVGAGIPYAAFGGGEPLAVPHVWEVFETLSAGGTALKIETDGLRIDDAAADRLADLDTECVQVSVDGADARTHEKVRPGGDFSRAVAAIGRLVKRSLPVEFVFVPLKLNLGQVAAAYDLAADLGARAFITGPAMRLGRAAADWDALAPSPQEWERASRLLSEHARARGLPARLSIYPWDILTEMETRLQSPQAMLLVVPDGKVKLLNALPFAPADLRRQSLSEAWGSYREAWASEEVRDFIQACGKDPSLLRHANETWAMGEWSARRGPVETRSGG